MKVLHRQIVCGTCEDIGVVLLRNITGLFARLCPDCRGAGLPRLPVFMRKQVQFGADHHDPNGVKDCTTCGGEVVVQDPVAGPSPCPACHARQRINNALWDDQYPFPAPIGSRLTDSDNTAYWMITQLTKGDHSLQFTMTDRGQFLVQVTDGRVFTVAVAETDQPFVVTPLPPITTERGA